jgi:hypothetical protein
MKPEGWHGCVSLPRPGPGWVRQIRKDRASTPGPTPSIDRYRHDQEWSAESAVDIDELIADLYGREDRCAQGDPNAVLSGEAIRVADRLWCAARDCCAACLVDAATTILIPLAPPV